jgi:hypothetical protein
MVLDPHHLGRFPVEELLELVEEEAEETKFHLVK